ncbi:MAG: NAD(P)/FAD-dependent oxidoreductase [bacterium]|nr:NAD(P)/FAD-dependent oxidoreductase [bacterium]
MEKIIVIGGGAAGLMAAIMAARRLGAGDGILILEHMKRVGRKLLATGNGRCNLTNLNLDPGHYHGTHPKFAQAALRQFGLDKTLAFFEELGIAPRVEEGGKIFPASGQASSVLDVLRYEVEERGIRVELDTRVTEVTRLEEGGVRCLATDSRAFEAARVIVATGGKSAPNLGSNGSGFKIAERLGHRIVEPFPALVQLRLAESAGRPFLRQLHGVRVDGAVEVIFEDAAKTDGGESALSAENAATEATAGKTAADGAAGPGEAAAGELLFTDYGISGLPVMQVSRRVSPLARALAQSAATAWLKIDLFPALAAPDLARLIAARIARNPRKPVEFSFIGLLHKRLIGVLLREAGVEDPSLPCGGLAPGRVRAIAARLKDWRLRCVGTQSWMTSQVTAGGVDVRQVDRRTMESQIVPGLFFAGEVLDIDGDCGGYNLQWAWSSGAVAGLHAAG